MVRVAPNMILKALYFPQECVDQTIFYSTPKASTFLTFSVAKQIFLQIVRKISNAKMFENIYLLSWYEIMNFSTSARLENCQSCHSWQH